MATTFGPHFDSRDLTAQPGHPFCNLVHPTADSHRDRRAHPAGRVDLAGSSPQATSAALLMCDVRAGRDRATRHELAAALVNLVEEHTGAAKMNAKVEFTQYTGDEMYHPFLGGFNRDWDTTEALAPTEYP